MCVECMHAFIFLQRKISPPSSSHHVPPSREWISLNFVYRNKSKTFFSVSFLSNFNSIPGIRVNFTNFFLFQLLRLFSCSPEPPSPAAGFLLLMILKKEKCNEIKWYRASTIVNSMSYKKYLKISSLKMNSRSECWLLNWSKLNGWTELYERNER